MERERVHVHIHAIHTEHDPGREGEQSGEGEGEEGSRRVASPSRKLVCTRDEVAIPVNPTTTLVPPSSAPRTKMGRILPPSSSSSHFPALDEAAGSHCARTLLRARNTTQVHYHLYQHTDKLLMRYQMQMTAPQGPTVGTGTLKMNAPKRARRWRGFSVGRRLHGCPRALRGSCDIAPSLNLCSNM